MGVNDYGGPTDSLAAVPFGGVGGWAEAVAAVLDNSDVPVSQRFTFTQSGLATSDVGGDKRIDFAKSFGVPANIACTATGTGTPYVFTIVDGGDGTYVTVRCIDALTGTPTAGIAFRWIATV